jgi:hypothetical protein
MKKKYVWIVEMHDDRDNSWGPTVGVSLTRDDARINLAEWRQRNPSDRFHLRKYVCEEN